MKLFSVLLSALAVVGCAANVNVAQQTFPKTIPVATFCQAAQKVVTPTDVPVQLVVHDDFDAFVKSKATIEGKNDPEIQQYNWSNSDGVPLGVSCKLKNTDHLNLVFGEGSAKPDGFCQDMNRLVYQSVVQRVAKPVYSKIVFDPNETVINEENPGMVGPDWLAPYTMTSVDADGALRIITKGFIVDFLDPRFAKAPPRFRGVHYCHLMTQQHMQGLLDGSLPVGAQIGQDVERIRPPDVNM